jgi:hypothetical protein
MYFIPYGLLLNTQLEVVAAAGLTTAQLSHLTLWGFLNNLIPVTIGNLIGGGLMVGGMYWFVYLRAVPKEEVVVGPEPAPLPELLALPEGEKMMKIASEPRRLPLFNYVIASADMFYSEVNERTIYIDDDGEGRLRISAETPTVGSASSVDLGNILLEYALTCKAQGDLAKAYRQIDAFGKHLGEKVAIEVIRSMPAEMPIRQAACALECILGSLNVPFSLEETDEELRYNLDLCPLCEVSEKTGLSEVELGHHGLSALCRGFIKALGSELGIRLPPISHSDHIFAVRRPTEAISVER